MRPIDSVQGLITALRGLRRRVRSGALAHQVNGAISRGEPDGRTTLAIAARDRRYVTLFAHFQRWRGEVRLYLAVLGVGLNLETARGRQAQFNFAFLGIDLDKMGGNGRSAQLN